MECVKNKLYEFINFGPLYKDQGAIFLKAIFNE